MADLGKSDTVVSNVQLDADSLEFDVNTNLPLTNTKASPGSAAPSLQELIEAELSARLCQPDSLEPPSSPTLHSLLSYDSIEPIPPALHTAPTSAPAFSLDSLADLDPFKDPGGPADDESGIDLLSPTKLAAFSNPDSLESTPDLLGSPTRCSQLRGEFHLLTDPPVQHTMYETGPVAQAPLLIMDERKVSITTAESQINTETNISQQIFDYVSSDSEATLQHHVTHISNMSVQSDVQISNSESDIQNVESISVSRSGEISQTFEELCTTTEQNVESISGSRSGEISQTFDKLCTTTEPIMSELPQEHSAPQPVHEVITEGGGWNTEGQATVGVTVTSDVTLTSSFPPTDLLSSSPPPNSSPQPPHTGALTPSSTNSVYGDSSHAGDDDRVGGGWSGDDGGGVEDPCHPPVCGDDPCLPPTGDGGALVDPTPSLGTHTNMEEERSDEDDFWSSMKKDDDDEVTHVSSRLVKEEEEQTEYTMKISKSSEYEVIKYSDNNEDEEENETKAYEEDEANMEEEEEEEDDEEEKGLRKKTKVVRPAENGVAAAKTPVEPKAPVEVKKKPPTENGVAKASEPPVAEKKKTVVEEKKPVREEKKPVREEKKPVREEKKPVIEEKKSVREEKKPVIEEKEGKKMAREENGIEGTEESMEKKKKKKSRLSEDGEKKSKKKKKKRGDSEKENKKATYQNREDIYERHIGPRIRSFDAAKMKSKFEKPKQVSQLPTECRQCGKQVFQMERIVAEKASWHKNCFRCKECNCILTLETYQSHEGVLYCKPHFKDLFRPKAVIEDEDAARRERLLRRPKMIVLESKPEALPEDVVRSTAKPDYGLEELNTASLKQKFAMFEQISTEEEKRLDPIPVKRSQSLLGKAARFMQSEDDDYGIENAELGEYEEYDEEEDEEEEEEDEEGEEGEKLKKKGRPTSFSGLQDLKAGFARKNRREEMTKKRREELSKFRQMLCAGKNISTREVFESGNLEDEEGKVKRKEQIKIDGCPAARNLRERFEKGLSVEEDETSADRREVDAVFRKADTASKARNLFKEIDTAVVEGNEPVMRPRSSAQARRDNRLSRDGKRIRNFTSQVFDEEEEDNENSEEEEEEEEPHPLERSSSLVERFKFFSTYEERAKDDKKKSRKLFRFTPPREGEDQGVDVEERELGRDPNLIRCTDNYEDAVDCRGTRDLLAKFRKLEMKNEDGEAGPRPLKRFTPPPGGEEEYDSDEEYSDEEYSDDEEDSEEEDEEEDDEEGEGKPKYKDEILEMVNSSQSARKAASLRAKFEKWESEVERKNEYNEKSGGDDEEEGMPSIDTARNLRAMFENKAQESARPVTERPKPKVNRFVGGGGDKCMLCERTVYAMERLEVAARVLHKNCFKCCKCNTKLSMNTFSIGGNDMYCTTHYKQAFTEKGTYDVFNSDKECHKQLKITVC